jgi:hypothetical protein
MSEELRHRIFGCRRFVQGGRVHYERGCSLFPSSEPAPSRSPSAAADGLPWSNTRTPRLAPCGTGSRKHGSLRLSCCFAWMAMAGYMLVDR